MNKLYKKIKVIFLSLLTIGMIGSFVSCNNEEDSTVVTNNSTNPQDIFFYKTISSKHLFDQALGDDKVFLSCDYYDFEKKVYGHNEGYFESIDVACKHMQKCIDHFKHNTVYYNITINGENWECPCFGRNCPV